MAIISNGTTIADAGAFSVNLGSMALIKTLTASSSANLSFVDGSSSVVLDNTYPVYLFKYINMHPATNDVEFYFILFCFLFREANKKIIINLNLKYL